MDEALEAIREATRGTEYEGRLYLVGGVLRDRMLGLPHREDLDLVLEGDAVALAQMLFSQGLSQHHPVLYPRFGTAKVQVAGHDVELVTARAESYESYNRKPSVVAASLRDDAFRRDFTINTLMENIHTGEVLDLTGRAREDIRAGVIRTPLDPHATFHDDPLRVLRAVRFACRFGFMIETGTWKAISKEAHRLNILGPGPPVVSAERIRDEFVKIVMTGDQGPTTTNERRGCVYGFELLRESGVLAQFFPELLEMVGVTQNAWHLHDVWTHTMRAMACLTVGVGLETRLGLMLHDVGKPRTRSEDERGVHFYEHQKVGADMAREALTRLKFTNDQIRDICELVARHMRLGEYRPEWSDAAVRRLIRDVHPYAEQLFTVAQCDMEAMRQDVPLTDLDALHERMEEENQQADVARIESPLDGNEIMAVLGVGPGPVIRRAKEFLVNEVIEGRLGAYDKVSARKVLCEWYRNGPVNG